MSAGGSRQRRTRIVEPPAETEEGFQEKRSERAKESERRPETPATAETPKEERKEFVGGESEEEREKREAVEKRDVGTPQHVEETGEGPQKGIWWLCRVRWQRRMAGGELEAKESSRGGELGANSPDERTVNAPKPCIAKM